MSTTIDQNVVEMRFDNSHFEKNVAQSMSTLDKFKQKLNFNGAEKGLDDLNSSAKRIDFSSIGNAADTVGLRFNAMYTMADQALRNITNSAMTAGKNIVSALTIDPVKTGLNEFETKMGAIQVIKANTRSKYENEAEQMAAIEKTLSDLNDYADRTIYNYTQMTDNLGKFINQGLDLDEAAGAVMGLANLAGASGATAADMARATYQMSQAMGGVIRKMDWNSLRNANMAGTELKNVLMDIARIDGIDMDSLIEKHGTFEETLQEGWLTGELFTKAMNIYSDVYSEAELRAMGFKDAQIENFKDLAKTAKEATVEVKTASQLWDVLKETAQSGWTQTWEAIFGDFNQTKRLFTDLQIYFSDIINGWSDARNFIANGVFNFAKPWKTILDKLDSAELGGLKKITDAVENVTDKLEYFQEVVNRVWRGEFNNVGDDADRFDLLTKAGYDPRVVQELVNKGYEYRLTIEDVEAAHEKYGLVLDESRKATDKFNSTVDESKYTLVNATEAVSELSDEKLRDAGLTEDEIALYRALKKEAKRLGISVEELTDKMSKTDGRTLFIESVKNAWNGLLEVLNVVKTAWNDIFNPPTSGEIIIRLYGILDALHEFSKSLTVVDRETGALTETGEKISSVFKGMFAAIDIVLTILKGPAQFVFGVFNKVLSALGTTALDVFAGIGDAIVIVRDVISDVIENVTTFIAEGVAQWITDLKEAEFFKDVAKWFEDACITISNAIKPITDEFAKIGSSIPSGLGYRIVSVWDAISNVGSMIINSELAQTVIDGVIAAFGKLQEFFSGFKLPEFNLDNLKTWAQDLVKIQEFAEKSGISGVGGVLSGVGTHIKENVVEWDWQLFKENLLEGFANFWIKAGDTIMAGFRICGEVLTEIKKFIFGTEEVNLPTILKVAEKFLAIYLAFKVLQTLNNMVSPLDNISDALDNLATSVKWRALAEMFKGMALALGVLTVSLVILSGIENRDSLVGSAIVLGSLMVAMGIIVAAIGFFSSKVDGGVNILGAAGSLLLIVMSIALLVTTLKAIDKLKLENPMGTFVVLAGILTALTVGVKMISKAGGSSFRSVAAILTLMAALKMMLEIIEAYDQFDWSGKTKAIERMMSMMVGLAVAINIASRGTKAGASSTGMALLLISMVISLNILLDAITRFAETPVDVLLKGGAAVLALLGVMTIMVAAMSFANKGMPVLQKGERSANNFVGLATALLAIVAAIWLLSLMDLEDLKTGGKAVAQILIVFSLMLGIIGMSCGNLRTGPVFTMLVLMGILMAELMQIIKSMDTLDSAKAIGNAAALALLLVSMATVMQLLGKNAVYSSNATKWLGALIVLAVIIAALGFVLSSMKSTAWENSIGNVVAIGILLAAMAGVLVTLNNNSLKPKSIGKWALALGGVAIIIGLLAFALSQLKGISAESAIGGAVGIGILLAIMTAFMQELTKVDMRKLPYAKIIKFCVEMMGVWVVMVALALLLQQMNGLDPVKAVANSVALGVLLSVMTNTLRTISKNSIKWSDVTGSLAVMAILTALLVPLVAVMYMMQGIDPLNSIGQVAALGVLLNAIAGAVMILSNSKNMSWKKMGTVLISMTSLTAILALLGLVLMMVRDLDVANALGHVSALSILLLAMTGAISILVKPRVMSWKKMGTVLISMASLTAILALLGLVLHMMSAMTVQNAITNAIALGVLLNAMAAAMFILGLSAHSGSAAIIGMYAMTGVVALLAVVISELMETDYSSAMPLVMSLSTLLLTMTAVYVILGATGPMATSAAIGALALVGVIAILGLLIAGICALMDSLSDADVSNIKTQITEFMGILYVLTEGIGKVVAGLVVGFTEGLVAAGEDLRTFADSFSGIDPKVATGALALCEAIGALTAATFWDGINDIIFGENSLSNFGAAVADFAVCIKDASVSLKGLTDDDVENVKRGAAAGAALAELEASIPRKDGWLQTILGSQDIAKFGERIVLFADCLINYSNKLKDNPIDADKIKESADAASALTALEGSVPSQGGWKETILGSQDISKFGERIVAFAACLIAYNDAIVNSSFDADKIKASADAAAELAKLEGILPPKDGWLQTILGSQDIEKFGSSLDTFGQGLVDYAGHAAKIDQPAVDAITFSGKAVDAIKTVISKIGTSGGWGAFVFGETDLVGFGSGLTSIATGISDYCSVASYLYEKTNLNMLSYMPSVIDKIKEALDSIPDRNDLLAADLLKTSINNLSVAASAMHTLSTSEYDYSGLTLLNTAIETIGLIPTLIDISELKDDMADLKTSANDAKVAGDYLNKLSGYTYTGVYNLVAALETLGSADINAFIEAFNVETSTMTTSVQSVVDAIADGLLSGVSKVSVAATTLANTIMLNINGTYDRFEDIGEEIAKKLALGIMSKNDLVNVIGEDLGAKAVSGANTQYTNMRSAGAYLGSGLVLGMNYMYKSVYDAGYALGQAAVLGEKAGQQSNSPSKLTILAGNWLGEGLIIGMQEMGKKVYESGNELGDNATNSVSSTIAKIAESINSDLDVQPTIRPVIDLSDVKTGVNAIGSMFGNSSVGVSANIGAVSSMMNRNGQNGRNDDVIAELSKLNRKMDNIGNTTYQINGVTYDDGSNIASAVQTITRAALRERRM